MMTRVLSAAGVYFGLVFALGFVLGTVRTLALAAAPEVSRFQAVLIEAPIMLAASWFACAFVITRCALPRTIAARAGMGGGAFVMLVLAELALAVWLAGLTPAEHLRAYAEPSHALGLAAQMAFGLFPLVQLRR
jgi:hypothetical protein